MQIVFDMQKLTALEISMFAITLWEEIFKVEAQGCEDISIKEILRRFTESLKTQFVLKLFLIFRGA